jgi:excinuclease UvrABC nuclease subunit
MSETQTALYRHFDKSGALLYVGISLDQARRLSQHTKGSRWKNDIADVKIEYFDSRELALEAERAAIMAEAPKHNIVYRDSKPSKLAKVSDTKASALRANLGLSVAAMAQLVGVTRQGWYKIERVGEASAPVARLLAYIERYGPALARKYMEREKDV